MILPILISWSVAPVSYFFCASAPLLDAASSARAVTDAIAILFANTVMTFSLWSGIGRLCLWRGLLDRRLFVALISAYHLAGMLTRKSPPHRMRRAASLVAGWRCEPFRGTECRYAF